VAGTEGGHGERQNTVKNGEKGAGLAAPERASKDIIKISLQILSINASHVVLPNNLLQLSTIKEMKNLMAKCHSTSTPSARTWWSLPSPDLECVDIVRESPEYRTAFGVNLLCITVPLIIFYVMCAREFFVRLRKLEERVKKKVTSNCLFFIIQGIGRILWLCPVSVICAPLFIVYIPIRQVSVDFLLITSQPGPGAAREIN